MGYLCPRLNNSVLKVKEPILLAVPRMKLHVARIWGSFGLPKQAWHVQGLFSDCKAHGYPELDGRRQAAPLHQIFGKRSAAEPHKQERCVESCMLNWINNSYSCWDQYTSCRSVHSL